MQKVVDIFNSSRAFLTDSQIPPPEPATLEHISQSLSMPSKKHGITVVEEFGREYIHPSTSFVFTFNAQIVNSIDNKASIKM